MKKGVVRARNRLGTEQRKEEMVVVPFFRARFVCCVLVLFCPSVTTLTWLKRINFDESSGLLFVVNF